MPDVPQVRAALERGHTVHAWTQQLDEGGEVTPPDDIAGFCEAYRTFCYRFSPSWTHVEAGFDNGHWHGFIDRIGYLRGHKQLVIADVKTGKGHGTEAQERIATQLACYAMGWTPQYRDVLRVGIYLHDDGTWKTIVYEDDRDFIRWQTLLQEAIGGEIKELAEARRKQASKNHHVSAGAADHERPDLPKGVPSP